MGKSHKKGASRGLHSKTKGRNGPIEWTPKMTMNMSDLSRDDDFLNHLLVEKLGTGNIPLYVHKMDPMRPLPKTDPKDLMAIVQRLIVAKGPPQKAIKQAVDELLKLHAVLTFIKKFPQVEIDAFATHASRYFELYLPSGSIEIAHTSRYTHRTGKSELCILATRYMAPGTVITELKGSMAKLTREDEKELKRNSDIRRDFSVIHSGQMKQNHLFLGPARFVNHDCENNCELFREGKYITFRVLRPIAIGEEITAHYGDGYFGRTNRHCLCATCEKNGRGGYAPQQPDADLLSGSESDSDSDSDTLSSDSDDEAEEKQHVPLNVNERRTRRGVYHIAQDDSDDSDDSDAGDKSTKQEEKKDVTKREEQDAPSDLSSLPFPSNRNSNESPVRANPSRGVGMMTPISDTGASPSSQAHPAATDTDELSRKSSATTPYKSIIATRRQKAAAAQESISTTITKAVKIQNQLVTPPPSVETASLPDEPNAPVIEKRVTRSASTAQLVDKGKGKATEADKEADEEETEEPEVTRVLRTRPSAHASLCVVGTPVKPEIPRDERGRPLPTCITCFNILPIIHVDREVVWGVGKQKEMRECPRCMRHFAIYNHPWPARTAGQRARFMPTPREELTPVDPSPRRVTPKVLPVLDRKLAAAAKSPSKIRRSESSAEEPPAKKRKTETGSKVTMSAKAEETLVGGGRTRSGRHSVPSTKAQESSTKKPIGRPRSNTPPPRTFTPVSKSTLITESVSVPSVSPSVEPRKFSQRKHGPSPWSRSTKSAVVLHQPRDGQGRFGTKASTNGKFMRKRLARKSAMSRAQRAVERDKVRSRLEGETVSSDDEDLEEQHDEQGDDEQGDDEQGDEGETPLRNINGRERKRRKDVSFEPQDSSKKRARFDHNEGVDSISASHRTPIFGVSQFSAKRIGGLSYQKPNPMNLARSTWLPKAYHGLYAMSDTDTEPAHVPENNAAPPPSINVDFADTENWRKSFNRGPIAAAADDLAMSPVGALTFKPSPGNYAKRRWSSEVWASKSTRDSSPNHNDRSDAEDSSPGYSDNDNDSIDVNIDYKKRFSAYYIMQREDAPSDGLSSEEEDVLVPEVADKYALQRRASFHHDAASNSGRATDNTDDSKRVIERLAAMSDDNSAYSFEQKQPTLAKQEIRIALPMKA